MPRVQRPDFAGGRLHHHRHGAPFRAPGAGRRGRVVALIGGSILLAAVLVGSLLFDSLRDESASWAATPTKKPAGKTTSAPAAAGGKTEVKPVTPPPGFQEMSQLAFLTGNWAGQLKAMPIFLDISIKGAANKLGGPLQFQIHAEPPKGAIMKMGLEGDFNAVASYSPTYKAVRAVLTDPGGRGVEMVGEREAVGNEWLFNSTAQGAPFPFKVRVKPVGTDQIVVAYSSGGRMPLKYEVIFNRVDG